jgi:hypothetical protein
MKQPTDILPIKKLLQLNGENGERYSVHRFVSTVLNRPVYCKATYTLAQWLGF